MKPTVVIVLLAAALGCGNRAEQATEDERGPGEVREVEPSVGRPAEDKLLDELILYILTSEDTARLRKSIAIQDKHSCALIRYKEDKVSWPRGYTPDLPGFVSHFQEGEGNGTNSDKTQSMIGLRLDKCDINVPPMTALEGNVSITIMAACETGISQEINAVTLEFEVLKNKAGDFAFQLIMFRG